MGLMEIGGAIISQATQRVETAAQNLANMTTPGFKARSRFSDLVIDPVSSDVVALPAASSQDFSTGKLQQTGNPLDLAISGSGFFTVRASDGGIAYTRDGQFARDADGHLALPDGAVLQSINGDVTLESGDFSVLSDGTVQQDGHPVAQLAIVNFDDLQVLQPLGASLFAAPANTAARPANPGIRQGMLEASNVSTASEMLAIMKSSRSAESGQRVVQMYDDLMGQAITAFSRM